MYQTAFGTKHSVDYRDAIYDWTNSTLSARPEYYSGRGPTQSDLNSKHLEQIYQGIYGKEMPDDDFSSDDLRNHPNAPQWAKDWAGPFYITIDRGEVRYND